MGETRTKLNNVRKFIGKKLNDTKNSMPITTGGCLLDLTKLLALMEEMKADGKKVALSAFFAKALGIALLEIPMLNTRIENGDELIMYDHVNVGLAVAADTGLLVVVLKDCDKKDVFQINQDLRDLMTKVKEKKLTLDDTSGGTTTFSNVAKTEFFFCTSIVNNDECLITSLNQIRKEQVVMPDGSIEIRDMSMFVVNTNHTIVDATEPNKLFVRLKELIEDDPKKYLL